MKCSAEETMKRQWRVKRTVKETEDGQKRWDRAYLLVLEIARSVEPSQENPGVEVNHASSDLCSRVDSAPGAGSNH